LNPCGLIMDYLRSCYTTEMVFRDGDSAVEVEWYWTDPGAKCFPGWSRFSSGNWSSRDQVAGDLGEQPGPKPWRNGSKPANGWTGDLNAVACAKLKESWWQYGIPTGEDTGPLDTEGRPLCCVDGPPPPDDPCASAWHCDNMPDSLTAKFSDSTGTWFLGSPDGLEVQLVRDSIDPCMWFRNCFDTNLFCNVFLSSGVPGSTLNVECPDLSGKAFATEFQWINLIRDGPASCDCGTPSLKFTMHVSTTVACGADVGATVDVEISW